jgi:hypothetical protein
MTKALIITIGDTIKLTGNATGGSGEYTYSYIMYDKGEDKWNHLAEDVADNTYMWKAQGAGDREFYVDVKDKKGNSVRSEAIKVTVIEDMTVTAVASHETIEVGDSIALTAKVDGGAGAYTYSYIVYNDKTKKWARLANDIQASTFSWKASNSGARLFYVDVKDSTGNVVRSNKVVVKVN